MLQSRGFQGIARSPVYVVAWPDSQGKRIKIFD
jgi:hypothetical protein